MFLSTTCALWMVWPDQRPWQCGVETEAWPQAYFLYNCSFCSYEMISPLTTQIAMLPQDRYCSALSRQSTSHSDDLYVWFTVCIVCLFRAADEPKSWCAVASRMVVNDKSCFAQVLFCLPQLCFHDDHIIDVKCFLFLFATLNKSQNHWIYMLASWDDGHHAAWRWHVSILCHDCTRS